MGAIQWHAGMSTSHTRNANVDRKAFLELHFKSKATFKLAKCLFRLYEIILVLVQLVA